MGHVKKRGKVKGKVEKGYGKGQRPRAKGRGKTAI